MNDQSNDEAVRQAVLDYVEGVYEGDLARIERSIHPELAKRGFFVKQDGITESIMTFAELLELARNYKLENAVPPNAPKDILIYEALDHTASIRLTALWGIDYMLLAKYGEKWLITHVLWQTHPQS